ncbi:MAG: hypothetical protein OSJ43_06465 [Oscillospiraceae bacterium]|nr:hypothetical protein [Oscillospiraceae bacterium]
MAENKDFQIGNKAKDLLIYTFKVTKPVGDKSIDTKDLLAVFLKVKEMPPDNVTQYCEEIADKLKRSSDKQGFPKSTVHTYIKLIREAAVQVVVNVQTANECRFETEYDKRLMYIDEILKNCNLLLQLIEISLELEYINIKRCQFWTKAVTDVKYMTLSWKKKDTARAEALRKAAKEAQIQEFSAAVAESALKNK